MRPMTGLLGKSKLQPMQPLGGRTAGSFLRARMMRAGGSICGWVLAIQVLAQEPQPRTVGLEADRVNWDIQCRIEMAVRRQLPGWDLAVETSRFGKHVQIHATHGYEQVVIRTVFMASTEDARRRLESQAISISVGPGLPVAGIGQAAYLDSHTVRFRQDAMVVRIQVLSGAEDQLRVLAFACQDAIVGSEGAS